MSTENPAFARRTDLDALRAVAMLLGIVLHASLSFFPSTWMVSDRSQDEGFGFLFSAIHGFRMQLFFVMSGYFSAMLLDKRGRRALVKHRFRRVFLPLSVGMFTIVPLTNGVSALAISRAPKRTEVARPVGSTIWSAARAGDVAAVEGYLASGTAADAQDANFGGTPLMWAAVADRAEVVKLLLARGANPNAVGNDGGTALHGAAFLGHVNAVEALIQGGANVNATNKAGTTVLDTAVLDLATTRYFASILQLDLVEDGLEGRKAAITESLRRQGAISGSRTAFVEQLLRMPLFGHLWFLWLLWWLVLGYAAVSALGSRFPRLRPPAWSVLSPARYLWLIPLTMIPQWFMGEGGDVPIFGPDTSTGLLPIPHVLAYYAIFFGFGALYFGYEDRSGRVGERWRLSLAIGLFVVLPIGLSLLGGSADPTRRVLSVFVQATYPWLLTFGLMGLFRRIRPDESPTIRYLSDSAYWLYLAHVPLVIAVQLAVRDWPIPALVKFSLIVVGVTAFLLWTYQVMVRYTALGRALNGPRERPERISESSVSVAS